MSENLLVKNSGNSTLVSEHPPTVKKRDENNVSIHNSNEVLRDCKNDKELFKSCAIGAYFGSAPGIAFLGLNSLGKDETLHCFEKALEAGTPVKEVLAKKALFLKDYKKTQIKAGKVALAGLVLGALTGLSVHFIKKYLNNKNV